MLETIVPYVESHYRVRADRKDRALAGLSLSGDQTLYIAFHHPGLFSAIGVFSAGWSASRLQDIKAGELSIYKARGRKFGVVWAGVGDEDIGLAENHTMPEEMKKYGIESTAYESLGFHAWNIWWDHLRRFAPLLFALTKQFRFEPVASGARHLAHVRAIAVRRAFLKFVEMGVGEAAEHFRSCRSRDGRSLPDKLCAWS